jgi:hypothetical protein
MGMDNAIRIMAAFSAADQQCKQTLSYFWADLDINLRALILNCKPQVILFIYLSFVHSL